MTPFFPMLLLQLTQIAESSSCRTVGQPELIAIIALIGGLLAFAATANLPAISIVAAKVLAGLAIGASFESIILPFQAILDIAAVVAVVEGIKHILGCG
ncbi:hypothetical protein [Microcoleus sp. Pol12B5]|uniref:hypothetical protein n=1 Tax=Microcoleus sp. Pol12B5 TaxID=3055396 RepID=UPI002FCED26C